MFKTLQTLLITLAALFFLSACGGGGGGGTSAGGTSTASGSSASAVEDGAPDVSVQTAYLSDSRVSGVAYASSGKSGTTSTDGAFSYIGGEKVTFSIGSVVLGSITSVNSDTLVTPQDLAGVLRDDTDSAAVILIAQFLQTLDSDDDPNNGISIAGATASKFTTALDLSKGSVSAATLNTLVKDKTGKELVSAASAIAHLRASLNLDNIIPLATTDGITAYDSLSLTGTLSGMDGDSDTLTYTLVSSPVGGELTLGSDGTFTYTPSSSSLSDSFTYTVNDGKASAETKSVSVAIQSLPLTTATLLLKSINEDSAATFSQGDFPAAASGDTLKVNTLPSNGSLSLNGNRVAKGSSVALESIVDLEYIPDSDYAGTDSFSLSVVRDGSTVKTYAVTLSIAALNDLPIFTNASSFTTKSGSRSVATLSAEDRDNDTITYSIAGGKDQDLFTLENNQLLFISEPNYNAPNDSDLDNVYLVTVKADDGRGYSTQSIQIKVTASDVTAQAASPKADAAASSNEAPVPTFITFQTLEDSNYLARLSGTDSNADTLTFTKVTDPAKGTLTLNSNGMFTYTPNSNVYGNDAFYYKINDGTTDSRIQGVSITVTAVDDTPVVSSFEHNISSKGNTFNWKTSSGSDDNTTAIILQQGTKGIAGITGDTVTYVPNDADEDGSDSFYIKITASNGSSNIIKVTVTWIGQDDTPEVRVTAITPTNGSMVTPYTSEPITITFSEAMDSNTLTTSTIVLNNDSNCSSIGYDAATLTAKCYLYDLNNTSTALKGDSNYTITVTTGAQSAAGVALASDTSSSFSTSGENLLPRLRTGQTSCYNELNTSFTIDCNNSNAIHDDGWYVFSKNLGVARSFERNSTSMVVTDKATGLQWQDDNETNPLALSWTMAGAECENSTFAGYDDWRLPEIQVLNSIADFNGSSPAIFSDFSNTTASNNYWSSSTYAPLTVDAWVVYFGNGGEVAFNKTNSYYVRCVRAGQFVTSSFVRDDSAETVLDTTSGLMWEDDNSSGSGNWSSAINQCENLTLGGYSDWRLPNITELSQLIDRSTGSSPAISTVFQNAASQYYWSSTSYTGNNAWSVDFTNGTSSYDDKTVAKGIRCVRGGQTPNNFYLADNGMTVKCENAAVGETGTVNGVTYTAVENGTGTYGTKTVGSANGYDKVCTSHVTDMSQLFLSNSTFNDDISSWDTSNVTTLSAMFYGANAFNQPLGDWNTSNVTDMSQMFYTAYVFNQPIGDWDTSHVVDMNKTFYAATTFNQPLGDWNTSSVVGMDGMFYGADAFNQFIGNWDTSHVTSMSDMFYAAGAFNQPIGNWDISSVTDMGSMFNAAAAFNQPLNNWDTSHVATMSAMFDGATAFNQPIGDWNTSSVTTMLNMFKTAVTFNQSLGDWNVSKVAYMNGMFQNTAAFDQNLTTWCTSSISSSSFYTDFDTNSTLSAANIPVWGTCPTRPDFYLSANGVTVKCENATVGSSGVVNSTTYTAVDNATLSAKVPGSDDYTILCTSHVTNMSVLFNIASTFNQDISSWDTSNVTSMDNMFNGASAFNQDIGYWDTGKVVNMMQMFYGAIAFNQDISRWDTGKLSDMRQMFGSAIAFNKPIGYWNTRNVTDMGGMFNAASAFNQPIGNWNTGNVTDMGNMFYGAAQFNQNISSWDVCNVTNHVDFSTNSNLSTTPENEPQWDMCP